MAMTDQIYHRQTQRCPRRNFRDDVLVFPDGSRLALPADDVFFQTLVSGRLDRKTAEVIRQSLHRGAVGMRSGVPVDGQREVREIRLRISMPLRTRGPIN